MSIEDLFAEAVAAVESISSDEIELEVEPGAEAGGEDEVELDIEVSEPESDTSEEESRLQEQRASRKAKLKARMAELERSRDEATERGDALRTETIRLKATNQRLRERLDRLQSQNDSLEDARRTAEQQISRSREAQHRSKEDLQHLQERRRQEQNEQKQFGQAPAILATLPILDHLQMAIDHAAAEPGQIIKGVEMVIAQFHGVLRRLGVQRIECKPGDAFMPKLHDAMLHTPSDSVPVGHIVQEISAGYSLNGRLIRASRVSVAAEAPTEPLQEPLNTLDTAPESSLAQAEPLPVDGTERLEE
ncbi:MAG: nucleotide exchange factor GrpE [Myxococcota bacterium]|nr:nucleotide exchange factor GrpE [Myxococcota bacterium]